ASLLEDAASIEDDRVAVAPVEAEERRVLVTPVETAASVHGGRASVAQAKGGERRVSAMLVAVGASVRVDRRASAPGSLRARRGPRWCHRRRSSRRRRLAAWPKCWAR